jgi:hypothetical protein
MANIAVREFTYKSVIDKDTITVSVYADGKLIKDLEFSAIAYTTVSAEASVKFTAENFGILGPGNEDLYEKAVVGTPQVETSAETVYKYQIKKFGPKKYIVVYQISNTGEKEIYQSQQLIGSTPDEVFIRTAIEGLSSTYPGVENMTPKTPTPPPVPSTEPPITSPPSPLPDKLKTDEPPKYLPQAKYKKAKRTSGGEFRIKTTGEDYKGFYIETYRKQYFAGETPEQNGVELEKIERTESTPDLNKLLSTGISLLALLQSAFKKQLSQDEVNKGIAKRYFVQDNRDKKISETSQELFEQGKKDIPDFIYKEVSWNISNPADDIVINGAKFQGSESRNKETIQNLEKEMPGISKFVTDYRYLIPETPVPTPVEQAKVQTQVIKDPYAGQQDFRKANFDLRK